MFQGLLEFGTLFHEGIYPLVMRWLLSWVSNDHARSFYRWLVERFNTFNFLVEHHLELLCFTNHILSINLRKIRLHLWQLENSAVTVFSILRLNLGALEVYELVDSVASFMTMGSYVLNVDAMSMLRLLFLSKSYRSASFMAYDNSTPSIAAEIVARPIQAKVSLNWSTKTLS